MPDNKPESETADSAAADTPAIRVKSAVYTAAGSADCLINFNDEHDEQGNLLFYPYHAMADDPDPAGRQLFADLKAGKYGKIAPFIVTDAVLAQARQAASGRINHWRDTQENATVIFRFRDRNWDCSKNSLDRLAPVVTLAKSGTLPPGFFWTDGDNNNVPVTAPDLIALESAMIREMVLQGFKIHERQRRMKTALQEMTDIDQINSYQPDWPQTEPPGSNSTQAGNS